MYPGLFQQQQQNGTGQSGSTTPVTSNGTRRPGSPGSNGTGTPGPPELQNGVAVSAANGMPPQHGIQLFPAAYIDPSSGQTFLRGAAPTAAAAAAGLRLIQPQGPQGPMMMNNVLAAQPQTSLGFASNGSSSGASRRESMDRGSSSAFSPSLLEQYKNKGWTTSYALGTGKALLFMPFSTLFNEAHISGSGSLTPPPAAAAGLGTAGGLGLFGGQRFSSAPTGPGGASDRNAAFGLAMAAYASAAAARNAAAAAGLGAAGSLGFSSNNNLFNNTKTRHNSIDRASNNRSLLLEDFR